MPPRRPARKPSRATPRRRWAWRLGLLLIFGLGILGGLYWRMSPTERARVAAWIQDQLEQAQGPAHAPKAWDKALEGLAGLFPEGAAPAVAVPPARGDLTHTYAGMPLPTDGRVLTLLRNRGYLVGYDEGPKNPAWAAYRVTVPATWDSGARPENFEVDNRTRARVRPDWYTGSGYDRGHLAPNYAIAVCHGRAAQEETFLMSNIVPQRPNLNRKVWNELEQRIIRRQVKRSEELWVLCGPVFFAQPETLGRGLAVPTACYMIVIDETPAGLRTWAALVPQSVHGDESIQEFRTSIDRIESLTALDFLHELPDGLEAEIEAMIAPRIW